MMVGGGETSEAVKRVVYVCGTPAKLNKQGMSFEFQLLNWRMDGREIGYVLEGIISKSTHPDVDLHTIYTPVMLYS
jgi:hypothetical protein